MSALLLSMAKASSDYTYIYYWFSGVNLYAP
jgi:hypothetical protein